MECAQSPNSTFDTGTRDEACLLTRSKACPSFPPVPDFRLRRSRDEADWPGSTRTAMHAVSPVPLLIAVAATPVAGHCLPLTLALTWRNGYKRVHDKEHWRHSNQNTYRGKTAFHQEADVSTLEITSEHLGQRAPPNGKLNKEQRPNNGR